MASGRALRLYRRALGVMVVGVTLTVLVTTGVWNPLPAIKGWWSRVGSLSQPAPPWTQRLGEAPEYGAITAGGDLVLVRRDQVEARDRATGTKLWQHDAAWALVANDVVVTAIKGRGYAVLDPRSGATLWSETRANAVWAYNDMILDLTCPGSCTLRSREHGDGGRTRWSVELPADARRLNGPNPELRGTREASDWFARAAAGDPGSAPPAIGLPVNTSVIMVDLHAGKVLRQVEQNDQVRLAVTGGRLVVSHVERSDSACRLSADAYAGQSGDPARAGSGVWHRDGYDLGTASGGCEQRRDPLGGGGVLAVVRADRHPALLDAASGKQLWVGGIGEQVLDTDGTLALVQAGEGAPIRLLDLRHGGREVTRHAAGARTDAAITPYSIIIRDRETHRIFVLSRSGQVMIELKTRAEVIGSGRDGIVLNDGRTIGVISVSGLS